MAARKRYSGQLADESFLFKEVSWEIPNVLRLPKRIDWEVRSAEFSFANGTWVLCMYPWGRTKHESKSFIDFTACRLQALEVQQDVHFKIFIKTCHGREFEPLGGSYQFTSIDDKDGAIGVIEFVKFSKLVEMQKALAPGGTLTVVFQLRAKSTAAVETTSQGKVAEPVRKSGALGEPSKACCKSSIEAYTQTEGDFGNETLGEASKDCKNNIESYTQTEDFDLEREQLKAVTSDKKFVLDFKNLLLSEDLCDVILQVKGQKFQAHRAILKARSPVFASMLSHNMLENKTGLIDIADCDPEHFLDFLGFLYCGSIENITSQNACSLYRAADKYAVQDLQSECLAFIKSHLDVDNFCDVITLALQHSEADLIKQSTDFFGKNMLEIVMTVKWQEFLTENPIEGNKLTIKALSAHKSSNP